MTVWADTREKIEVLEEFEREELPAGDYCIEGTDRYGNERKFLVERKEWAELAGAVMSGKIFAQLGEILEQDHTPVLLVEGNRNDAYSYAGAKRGQLRRFLSSIIVKMGVYVYQSNSPSDSLNFVADIDRWINDHRDRVHSVRETQRVPDEIRGQYIMEGFPGVGPGTAQDILDRFDTVYDVMTASVQDLQEVDGVGRRTAYDILDAAGALTEDEKLLFELEDFPGVGHETAKSLSEVIDSLEDLDEDTALQVDGIGPKTAEKVAKEAWSRT